MFEQKQKQKQKASFEAEEDPAPKRAKVELSLDDILGRHEPSQEMLQLVEKLKGSENRGVKTEAGAGAGAGTGTGAGAGEGASAARNVVIAWANAIDAILQVGALVSADDPVFTYCAV